MQTVDKITHQEAGCMSVPELVSPLQFTNRLAEYYLVKSTWSTTCIANTPGTRHWIIFQCRKLKLGCSRAAVLDSAFFAVGTSEKASEWTLRVVGPCLNHAQIKVNQSNHTIIIGYHCFSCSAASLIISISRYESHQPKSWFFRCKRLRVSPHSSYEEWILTVRHGLCKAYVMILRSLASNHELAPWLCSKCIISHRPRLF